MVIHCGVPSPDSSVRRGNYHTAKKWRKRYCIVCSGAGLLWLTTSRLVGFTALRVQHWAWNLCLLWLQSVDYHFFKKQDPFLIFNLEGLGRNLKICWFLQVSLRKSPFYLLPLQLIWQVCKESKSLGSQLGRMRCSSLLQPLFVIKADEAGLL